MNPLIINTVPLIFSGWAVGPVAVPVAGVVVVVAVVVLGADGGRLRG